MQTFRIVSIVGAVGILCRWTEFLSENQKPQNIEKENKPLQPCFEMNVNKG